MTPDTRLAAIADAVDRACALLASPDVAHLDDSAGILEGACASFAVIPVHEAAQSPADVRRLAESIAHASALLRHAAEFHESWRRRRNAMCSGYRPTGDAAETSLPARLCLQG